MNFKITTTVDSKLSYTPCYSQYGNLPLNYLRRTKPFVLFFVGGKLKFEYIYINKKRYYE